MLGVPVAALGINHHLIPLDELAHLGRVADAVEAGLDGAQTLTGRVLLSTCNRFEVYFESDSFHRGLETVLGVIRAALPAEQTDVADQFQLYAGEAAVQHLLEVASGLDSMVVGEQEIIGQVRDAITRADGASASLHRLFHAALTTAKAVTSQTDLGAAGRSIAQVGLELIERRHYPLAGRRALIVGTGSYARVVTAALQRVGCTELSVYSLSGRAEQFATSHRVRPVTDGEFLDTIAQTDLLVTCSGGERGASPALSADDLAAARASATALLPVLDLSLTGDVAAEAGLLVNIDLIDLEEIGAHAPAHQTAAVLAARDLVNRGVATYLHL